jgi:triphosphatase
MGHPREIELKFELQASQPAQLHRLPLLKRAASGKPSALVSVYFDTDKRTLRNEGLSLRVRRRDGHYVQTVKQQRGKSVGLFARDEWERQIPDREPDLDAARDTALRPFIGKKLGRKLKPIFQTRVRRQIFPIRKNGSKIELTIDRGKVEADGKSLPLAELELELKDGKPGDLFAVARILGKAVPLQVASTSKGGRGYALADGDAPRPVKPEPVALNPDDDWATAFKVIGRACLHQLAANQEALRDKDLEAVHQMRIALRRLRSAISLFSDMFAGPQTEAMKARLKRLTAELGPAREFDVFVKRAVRPIEKPGRQVVGTAAIAEDFRGKRADALDKARNVTGSAEFRSLILDAVEWIEAGDWLRNDEEDIRKLRDRSVAIAAAGEMQHRWKKIRKQGARLADLDARCRHKLRVKTKKLRYACEFFAGAFPGKKPSRRREKFVAKLKRLQGALGDLNDIVVHETLARQSVAGPQRAKRRKRRIEKAFAAGRVAGREEGRFGEAMVEAERAYRGFAKAKPFWH